MKAIKTTDPFMEVLAKAIADKLIENPDFLKALENKIGDVVDDAVDEAIGELEPSADDISGLDERVTEIVRNMSFTVEVDD